MAIGTRILHLPPYPKSWYVVSLSDELKAGEIVGLKFCGQEAVLYRTQSGQALLAEAFCPHMGANFAHGGKVVEDNLQCPFHGFCFDPTGKCVKTGYGTKPPSQAMLKTWPIDEVNGMIFAWHDEQGSQPDWRIPAHDWENWSQPQFAKWQLPSHPQEIAENSVDVGHFVHVHGYGEVKVFEEAKVEGPLLYGKYGMSRVANIVGKGGRHIHVEFNFYEYGLGYAFVEAYVVEYGLRSRHFVMPMPIDGKLVDLRIGVSVHRDFHPSKIHPLLGLLPKALLRYFINAGYFREYKRDVSDDFKVWENKAYVHPPALAQGDGPVILYRKWAEQFYADPPTAKARRQPEIAQN
jgi:nitrite reductase/ring-hydroxylating ferredoxin subunit